jgi:hypothetical protein
MVYVEMHAGGEELEALFVQVCSVIWTFRRRES